MLNISGINNGVVLDHIQAGKSMDITVILIFQELDCQIAIIKNARATKWVAKDDITSRSRGDLLEFKEPLTKRDL